MKHTVSWTPGTMYVVNCTMFYDITIIFNIIVSFCCFVEMAAIKELVTSSIFPSFVEKPSQRS